MSILCNSKDINEAEMIFDLFSGKILKKRKFRKLADKSLLCWFIYFWMWN